MQTFECIDVSEEGIDYWRKKYSNGLTFIIGDTHGEAATLNVLMKKIAFDPEKDHVYFLGDYNGGGDPHLLMKYISNRYQADYTHPGFHLIRGNHERELAPVYPLDNLPDLIVIRKQHMNYYLAHAGMVSEAFDLINQDLKNDPGKEVFAYRLNDRCAGFDAPLRQLVWSRRGLYSQKTRKQVWPRTAVLTANRACIIHGHTPYCYFYNNYFTYGEVSLFWQRQHIWFSEDLQSFNLDSNIKGRYENGEFYRGLTCLCLEALEEVVAHNDGKLTVAGLKKAKNSIFSAEYVSTYGSSYAGDVHRITTAAPKMKTISLDAMRNPFIQDEPLAE